VWRFRKPEQGDKLECDRRSANRKTIKPSRMIQKRRMTKSAEDDQDEEDGGVSALFSERERERERVMRPGIECVGTCNY
jgi:hypothetical protein